MKIEQEIEALKKRVKLLEEFRELQRKVEELEKQIAKPIIPYIPSYQDLKHHYPVYPQPYTTTPYHPWWREITYTTDDNTSMSTDSQWNMTFSS